jgi:hypothetical protein
VARVEWSRLSGDEAEAVIGIMLCREHPTATRVKPSQGDGGIDVWVPEGDTAIVYQIKSYTGNINASRRAKVKKSWKTLLDYAQENSITISDWYLVMPENPTTGQLKWLEELTKQAPHGRAVIQGDFLTIAVRVSMPREEMTNYLEGMLGTTRD